MEEVQPRPGHRAVCEDDDREQVQIIAFMEPSVEADFRVLHEAFWCWNVNWICIAFQSGKAADPEM